MVRCVAGFYYTKRDNPDNSPTVRFYLWISKYGVLLRNDVASEQWGQSTFSFSVVTDAISFGVLLNPRVNVVLRTPLRMI